MPLSYLGVVLEGERKTWDDGAATLREAEKEPSLFLFFRLFLSLFYLVMVDIPEVYTISYPGLSREKEDGKKEREKNGGWWNCGGECQKRSRCHSRFCARRGLPSPQKDSELVVDADTRSCRMCIAYIRLTVDCGHWGIGIRGYI